MRTRLNDGSRLSGDVHVRLCERSEFPGATHQGLKRAFNRSEKCSHDTRKSVKIRHLKSQGCRPINRNRARGGGDDFQF